MAPKFIPFEQVEDLADIEQLAQMLNLDLHRSATQLRGVCPVHGGDNRTLCISPSVRSRRGSLGVFFCQSEKTGGDRIGLVAHCMEIGQQDAAFFISQQFGAEEAAPQPRAAEPPAQQKAPQKREPTRQSFDPEKFWAHCVYSPELSTAGISEEDASRVLIGWHPRYKAHFIGSRNEDGSKAGFTKVDLATVKFPPQWLPQTNVVQLKRA